ncbi:MAG: PhnD/SsuA/transferrin family substrate-binding protein, partial [Promicromonosporaceae bacterium]|nr:PhnD/SsuA/transferrin family substrate-binding protein [Promicromonosporaceae bacterium]
IEAKNRNPQVDVLFVNGDSNGELDGAKYFAWLCVDVENADVYRSGNTFSIDNIEGKKMSFVSNSSTSGFRVPTSTIIAHFADENLDEDKLIEGGSGMFFSEVYFGGSHQGSAVNLISGNADVAAFCDIELQPYLELKSGEENMVGAVYAVAEGADAPFDQYAGREFVVIASTPVFNGPNAVNPMHLSEEEIEARGLVPHLLTLADVMCTGYHAAVSAGVRPGDVVAVIGDGAVGLSGVIAAKLLGASRIIAFSRHPERTALARKFGATDIIKERGAEAPGAVRDLLGGNLCDAALECVGTKESMDQSLAVVRGGGRVGFVGVPHGAELNVGQMFGQNLTIGGGMASARVYMETLLPRVLDGSITPGDVFDLTLPLTEAAAAYAAMDERRATKVLLRP